MSVAEPLRRGQEFIIQHRSLPASGPEYRHIVKAYPESDGA